MCAVRQYMLADDDFVSGVVGRSVDIGYRLCRIVEGKSGYKLLQQSVAICETGVF